jgi:hypothetical protein
MFKHLFKICDRYRALLNERALRDDIVYSKLHQTHMFLMGHPLASKYFNGFFYTTIYYSQSFFLIAPQTSLDYTLILVIIGLSSQCIANMKLSNKRLSA